MNESNNLKHDEFTGLLEEIKSCQLCADRFEHNPNPIVSISPYSKILIIGQAPGSRVHKSGIPWDDESGKQLRKWLGVSDSQFYDTNLFGLFPMAFCYPGKGKSGDLPPPKICAATWHAKALQHTSNVELIILIGSYSQQHYLQITKQTLTETVRKFEEYLPRYFPIVHPSPRNRPWLIKNSWYEEEVVPKLKACVSDIIS